MAHAQNLITIHQSVNMVYNFLMDGTKNPLWRPAVIDIQPIAGKPQGVGAVYKQGLKGPGGRRIDGDYEIVETTPNEWIKFQVIAGPARPTGSYQLQSVENGAATQVTFTLDLAPSGFMAKLMEPMISADDEQ